MVTKTGLVWLFVGELAQIHQGWVLLGWAHLGQGVRSGLILLRDYLGLCVVLIFNSGSYAILGYPM